MTPVVTTVVAPVMAPARPGLAVRLRGPAYAAVSAGAAAVVLLARDPHRSGSYGFCPFRAITGLPCPFCGGLRAGYDLLHGRVVDALSSNALVVLMALSAPLLWGLWVRRRWSGTGREEPPLLHARLTGVLFGVVSVVFCVLRWFPEFAWLRP